MKTRKSSFYPLAELKGKRNYKEYDIIEQDGSVLKRIFLNVPIPALREKLICFHYLSRRVKLFSKEPIGFKIISRDSPWDFKIDLSSGELLNVEITSIAEDSGIFKNLKREERLLLTQKRKEIELHELEKLNYFFPDSSIEKIIKSLKDSGIAKTELVENPWNDKHIITFGRISEKQPNLSKLIEQAITKKEKKKHSQKEQTILILDNRTFMYEVSHLQKARKELNDFIEGSSFLEIWFYTGYYSSLDGNDTEFNLTPLKVTSEQENVLLKYLDDNPPDEKGFIYT